VRQGDSAMSIRIRFDDEHDARLRPCASANDSEVASDCIEIDFGPDSVRVHAVEP